LLKRHRSSGLYLEKPGADFGWWEKEQVNGETLLYVAGGVFAELCAQPCWGIPRRRETLERAQLLSRLPGGLLPSSPLPQETALLAASLRHCQSPGHL